MNKLVTIFLFSVSIILLNISVASAIELNQNMLTLSQPNTTESIGKEDLKHDSANDSTMSDLKIKLNAFAHFQAGYRTQNNLNKDEKNVSKYHKHFAFYNDTALIANISNETDGMKYGGKIVLVPTARKKGSPTYNGSNIYIESNFGKIELGSPLTPAATMIIDAGNITAGSGNWARYIDLSTAFQMQGKSLAPSFATYADFFLDSRLITNLDNKSYSSEPARSIVYYTPKLALNESTNVTIGIAYTPDSSNTGADSHNKNSAGSDIRKINSETIHHFDINNNVKDAISGGISFETNISDGVDLKVAFTGEHGKSAGSAKVFANEDDKEATNTYKLRNLKAYNIGAVLNVGNFSYAGSYGDLGKSLTTPEYHKAGQKTHYYTGGIAYKQGPASMSLSYFKSSQFKNDIDVITAGASYQLAPGLKPYIELSSYRSKGRPEFYPELERKKTNGLIFITGVKLNI